MNLWFLVTLPPQFGKNFHHGLFLWGTFNPRLGVCLITILFEYEVTMRNIKRGEMKDIPMYFNPCFNVISFNLIVFLGNL